MNESFSDYLRNNLHRLFPNSKDNGARTNVLINCPLCIQEGRPDTNHHMSICLGIDGKPLMYNCFRNNSHRGLLTSDALLKLTWNSPVIIETSLLEAIDEYNKHNHSYNKYKLITNNRYSFDNIKIDYNYFAETKRQYISKRLGIDLSLQELEKNKIIFSLTDFLHKNYITQLTRSKEVVDIIDKYFVGFLTHNNGTIIFRNMVYNKIELPKSINFRYIKYSIVQGNSVDYYIIPSMCDITKRLEIHIGEGTFDILSVFYNLRDANRINNIYASIGGNSYKNIIKHFLCNMGIIDPILHIYIDNDIKPFVLPQLKRICDELKLETYIHMNTFANEKDFGVSKTNIKEYIYRL